MHTAIRTAMLADGTINTACGGYIFRARMPQDHSSTAVVFTYVGGASIHTSGGLSTLADGVISMTLYAPNTTQLDALKAAVLSFWNGKSGSLDSEFVHCASVNLVAEDWAEDFQLYWCAMTIEVSLRNP